MHNGLSMLFRYFVLFIVASFFFVPELSAARVDQKELREAVRAILIENPDIVLDILRDNSEAVLDIAQQGSEQRRSKALRTQWSEDIKHPKKVTLEDRPTKGPADAPVTIVAFTDFTCLYCQQGEAVIESILKAYPTKVRLVYKSLPVASHPGSVESAEFMLAAWAQDKKKSWELFHEFFSNRNQIIGKGSEAYIRSVAMKKGLNMQKLLAEAKGAKVKRILREDEQDARTLKVQGTPYFLVNDIVIKGALDQSLFAEAVDMALAAKTGKK